MSFAIEALGATAAVITTLCWVPQAWRIVKTRDARAVSLPTYAALGVGSALWLAYGILIGSVPVIGANLVTFLLVSGIVALKLRFG
jgi:MtN3 and saliva related transmembrane protein